VAADRASIVRKRRPRPSRLTKRRPAGRARTYSVYIIELSRACTREPCALAPLYVGQTAHTPEHRFAQHKAGGMLAAGKPHRFGKRLRLDRMDGIGPFATRTEAEAAEQAVAEALVRRGHRVFWG
jgi:predicted GIY-YIG superfamily endonuclease